MPTTRRNTGAAGRRRSAAGTGARRKARGAELRLTSVDFELAGQIVTAAEKQWMRLGESGKPMPLALVLKTYDQVLRDRGNDPVRDDHTLYQVRAQN